MPTERSRLLGERRSDIQSSLDESRSFGSSADGIEANKGLISRLRYGKDRLWTILYATFVASLGSFSFGYCLGYSSPVLVQLGDPSFVSNISHAPFNTSSIPTDFFGVSFCFNCFVLYFSVTYLSHSYGRFQVNVSVHGRLVLILSLLLSCYHWVDWGTIWITRHCHSYYVPLIVSL